MLQCPRCFVSLRPVTEAGHGHATLLRRSDARDFPGLPPPVGIGKALRQGRGGPSEPDALGLCCRDTLRLSRPDVGALVLRHEGENLQDNIAEESPCQILAPPGVQQGHVQHHDVHPLLFGEDQPLILDFLIVSSQPVDALDIEQVVRL